MARNLLALLLAALFITGCSDAGGGKNVWRFALEEVKGSVQWQYAQKFKTLVEKRSGGEVSVEVYPYGSLGTSADLTQQVQQNAVQFAFASAGHLGSVVPEVQLFVLHFVFSDNNKVNHKVLSGNEKMRQLLSSAYSDHGLAFYDIVPEGWMVWTAGKPIERPSDFEGVKIRTMVSPLLVDAYEAYGANPTPMPYGEVYGGLQMGVIDAQVNPVFAIQEMSFYEVQQAMTMARHSQFVSTVAANPGFLKALPEKRRQMLTDIRTELADYAFRMQTQLNDKRLARIKSNSDIEIVELSDEQRAAFRERSMPVREQYRELAGPRGAKLLKTVTDAIEAAEAAAGDGE